VIALPTALALKHAGLDYLLFDAETARLLRGGAGEAVRKRSGQAVARPRESISPRTNAGASASEMPAGAPLPEKWPRLWRECLQKTQAAPILWTYWELGRDLGGAPDPGRKKLLQGLLKGLEHPKGTHCFWPSALPPEGTGEPEADASLFWAGVRLLKSRAVIIMGSGALRAVLPPAEARKLRPHMQKRLWGHTLVVLHSPDTLIKTLADETQAKALHAFLRTALEPFSRP
jgi:hypothetical protein